MECPSFGIRLKSEFDPSKPRSMILEYIENGRPCWIEDNGKGRLNIRCVKCRQFGRENGPINHRRDCPPVPHDVRELQSVQLDALQQYARNLAGWDVEEVMPQSVQREYRNFMSRLPLIPRHRITAWLDLKKKHVAYAYSRLGDDESGSDESDSETSESGSESSEQSRADDSDRAVLVSPHHSEEDQPAGAAGEPTVWRIGNIIIRRL